MRLEAEAEAEAVGWRVARMQILKGVTRAVEAGEALSFARVSDVFGVSAQASSDRDGRAKLHLTIGRDEPDSV